MKVRTNLSCLITGATGVLGLTGQAFAQGLNQGVVPAYAPATTLSVDINGGIIASNNATTLGSNGPSANPTVSPVNGYTFSPWGGPTGTSGDGTQLPDSQASPAVTGASITKAFGTTTVTITNNTLQSATAAAESLNSRDRGNPTGTSAYGDLYRDLIFAPYTTGNGSGQNSFLIQFSGLTANTTYGLTFFVYDNTGTGVDNFTAANPFTAEQAGTALPPTLGSVSFTGGTPPATNYGDATSFRLASDATGRLSLYEYSTVGFSQNATVLNGFQISVVPAATPEPSPVISLIGGGLSLGILALRARRRPVQA